MESSSLGIFGPSLHSDRDLVGQFARAVLSKFALATIPQVISLIWETVSCFIVRSLEPDQVVVVSAQLSAVNTKLPVSFWCFL